MLDTLMMATIAAQHWTDNDHMDGWGWWVMGLGMVLVIVVVAALVFFVARESGRGDTRDRANAHETLDHRFARGEIDEDEYRARRDVLKS